MKTTNKIYIIAIVLTCSLSATLEAQVYVVNTDGNSIGEYGLDGSPVNTSLITGLNNPEGIAISGNDLYVVNSGNDTVGGYTTSGQTINASLITGLDSPSYIAVVPEPSPVSLAGLGAAALWLWRRRK